MEKGFSGIADVDLKILSELDDSSLFKACSVNKELFRICNKEPSFWKNRFIKKYGLHVSQYKPEDRSWKDHYMQIFIYLQKYKSNPIEFLNHIIWTGTVEKSYYLNLENGKYLFISEAPEEIQTNFWLLDLGDFRLLNFDDEYFTTYSQYTAYAKILPNQVLITRESFVGIRNNKLRPLRKE
jgi:hypothetical protein